VNAAIQLAAAGVGAIALAWPWVKGAGGLWQGLRLPPKVEAAGPSYTKAIEDLACVRLRLRNTSCLADDQLKAIDALTLALVAGSDKP